MCHWGQVRTHELNNLLKDSDQLDHGKVKIMKAIEKETLIGRIKWEIREIPKQELDTMADCYYFGATDLIHFARDINVFTLEQERYFTSKAYTAYSCLLYTSPSPRDCS